MNIFKKIFKRCTKEQSAIDTTHVAVSSIKIGNGYQVVLPHPITLDKSALIGADDLGRFILTMAQILNCEIKAPDSVEKI